MTEQTPAPTRRHVLKVAGALAGSAAIAGINPATSSAAGTRGHHPLSDDDLLELTTTGAAAALRRGRISAVRYTRVLLERAEELADLHAVITLNRKGVLKAARRVDLARRSGARLGPLAGVPLLIKDNVNTKKLPTTGGTPALKGFRPNHDGVVLRHLLAAGASVLGKANMHELAFGVTTTNFTPFAGIAHNPYDRSRVPGGSSGGTGAGVAARFAPSGLGSDTGGSVRIPASFNGVVGLRPSTGNGGRQRRYSTHGVLPLSSTLDTVGPLGRTVADVALLDAIITRSALPRPVNLRRVRLGIPPVLWQGLEREVAAVTKAALEELQRAGVDLVETDLPDLLILAEKIIFPVALHEPRTTIPEYLDYSGADGITLESIAAQIASPDVRGAFAAVTSDADGPLYPDAVNVYRPQIQKLVADYFAKTKVDALLFPTVIVQAPTIDPASGSSTISIDGGAPVDTFSTIIRNMSPGSCVGMPGLTLPAGLSASGLPVGISIEGPIGSDKRILGIGMAIERLLGTLPAPKL